jgi:phosphoribosylformimino-5-aminoimidazole carboxamide ribotide isomerase
MLAGPNIESLKALLASTSLDVIAAGGISSTEDIKKLKAINSPQLKGVIIGKALYEGKVDLVEAIKACEG